VNQTLQQLQELLDELRTQMRSQWDRELPMAELLDDRWERARRLGFGAGTSIHAESYVYGDVKVGDNTWIGPFTLLDGSGVLRIGSGCDISAGVQIYTHDTVHRVLSAGQTPISHAPVTIGDRCHIGAQSVIAQGVTIGEHAVIGAGSFVNRDVPAYTVAVGTPCRPIGTVVVHDDGTVALEYEANR
jgi:acetyltransferase-like isoleucine patch superfamily enzyme